MAIVTTEYTNCTSHVDGNLEIEISKGDSEQYFLLNKTDEGSPIEQWFLNKEEARRLIGLLQMILE